MLTMEYNTPLWLACVDFEKAFDSVELMPLWEALRENNVPRNYICLLQSLYCSQQAAVQTKERSRSFDVTRGVRQGDPISSLLFIVVMQACFGRLRR